MRCRRHPLGSQVAQQRGVNQRSLPASFWSCNVESHPPTSSRTGASPSRAISTSTSLNASARRGSFPTTSPRSRSTPFGSAYTASGLLTVGRLLGQRAPVSEANQAATGRKGETVGEAGHDTARYRTGVRFRASVARSFGKRSGPALKGRSRAAQRREGRSGSGGRTDPYLPDSVSVSGGGQIVVL